MLDPVCFYRAYRQCIYALEAAGGPRGGPAAALGMALCGIAAMIQCDTDTGDAMPSTLPDPPVVADNGQDPNPSVPTTPEQTGIMDPSDPSVDQGSVGDAPVDGSSTDTGSTDWGGGGGVDEGGVVGDDGGIKTEDSVDA